MKEIRGKVTKGIEPRSKSPKGGLSDAQKVETEIWLVDFQTSRSQIEDYQEMQHNLLWVNVSAVGAIVTACIALKSDATPLPHFLLAVPFVSGFLGIYWVALGMKTITVSNYIRDRIAPRLRKLCGEKKVMGLEAYFREEAGLLSRYKILNLTTIPTAIAGATFLIFCGAGLIVGGIAVWPLLWGNALKDLWWYSLGLTWFLTLYGVILGIKFRSKS